MEFHPLTSERWPDLETLFGKRGACGGCWCMWWRQTRKDFDRCKGEGNRRLMKDLVCTAGKVPGILGYRDGRAVAWCSVAPREDFDSLSRSRVLRPLDDRPVWSLVCFFVAKEYRGQGLSGRLIRAAIEHVRANGGEIIEAYPTVTKSKQVPVFSSFMGFPGMFEQAGFRTVAEPSAAKRIMRYEIGCGPEQARLL